MRFLRERLEIGYDPNWGMEGEVPRAFQGVRLKRRNQTKVIVMRGFVHIRDGDLLSRRIFR
jgi:hypothetical protein